MFKNPTKVYGPSSTKIIFEYAKTLIQRVTLSCWIKISAFVFAR